MRSTDAIQLAAVFILDSASAWSSCGFRISPAGTLPAEVSAAAERDSARHSASQDDAGVIWFADGTCIALLGRQKKDAQRVPYPVVSYALFVDGRTSPTTVSAHSALNFHLLPAATSAGNDKYLGHPNGITCIDRLSLNTTSHADLGVALAAEVHGALASPRRVEDYGKGMRMAFWKVGVPVTGKDNRGEVLLEVIERAGKAGSGAAARPSKTTMWGFILLSPDLAKTHGFVDGSGRARKLKPAAQKGRHIFTFEKQAPERESMIVDVAVLSPEPVKEDLKAKV
ncbi:hypothetical protein DFJ74DRAFT_687513 [Hyaloraphidium curvatum]|nr:hypothetical protein DFJ74DRAFT_687513 [Hyaloraphidium curvatum]